MYAVIKSGGKQYRVAPGEKIKLEKLAAAPGESVTFDEVLMVGGDGEARVGSPLLADSRVEATVEEHGRGNKIIVYKFKRRKGYHKKQGHRQDYTKVHIDKLVVGGEVKAEAGGD